MVAQARQAEALHTRDVRAALEHNRTVTVGVALPLAELDDLDPGPVDANRHVVLALAGDDAGLAADALAEVDHHHPVVR